MLSPRRVSIAMIAFTAALPLLSQGNDDRPAGVAKNRCVRLGDSAGVVVTSRPGQSSGKASGEAKCELWIKLDGNWSPAILEQSQQLLPAR